SVHRLMLKSLACLPIQAQGETFGVLYLEHRLRPGRFLEADLDLLLAFADQAAIALRNARLVSELGKTNAALLEAKLQLEGLVATRTEELEDTRRELDRARDQLQVSYDRHGILGASPAMRRVFAILDRLRDSHVPVVIEGASGTGKELVARAIHHGGSRARGAFVAINCAAIPEPLLESELFGHVRGAFTGANRDRRGLLAQASGGTLFLDEVGDMPAKMQVDLLRVLQDGKVVPVGGAQEEQVDVRIVCATHKSLRALVSSGEFREDLFYRLNVVEVHLPALRERTSDIPLLAERFLRQAAEAEGGAIKRLSRGALAALMAYAFPGNVRELEHLLLNANVMVDGPVIQAEDLAFGGRQPAFVDALEAPEAGAPSPTPPSAPAPPPPAIASVGDFKANEKQQILGTLEATGWNRAKAARRLGMPRRTFYRRLKEYGIIE
ncbi:MAG: sigma-54-dependent Fis family transcriptional regulator, partial [Myxococcales bacterium]|nr:sigma-54-dependent Fis family transcriptional regulator [Myxococcales bacterium]